MDNSEKLEKGRIQARFIIEMLGAPKEHIEDLMKKYIEELKKDQSIEITSTKFNNAEKQGKFFTTYSEIEIWLKDLPKLVEFCFDAMPSSVEILQPESFKLDSPDFSGLLNDLQAKLHKLDMSVKNIHAQNKLMTKNSSLLFRNLIIISAGEKGKTIEQISKQIGIPAEQITKFIEGITTAGLIEKQGDIYKAVKK